MNEQAILLTVLAMAVVTYVPRALPATFLPGRRLPYLLEKWLRFVPVSILSAMLASELLFKGENLHVHYSNEFIWAGLVAFFFSLRTRSLMATVCAGVIAIALIRAVNPF